MKKIRLTESGLKTIIKHMLTERLGVPNNITEVAKDVFSAMLWLFPEKYDLNSRNKEYYIDINKT